MIAQETRLKPGLVQYQATLQEEAEQRRQALKEAIAAAGPYSSRYGLVVQMARRFQVCKSTIRRDLATLAKLAEAS